MTEVETIELRPEGQSPKPRLALIVAMTVIAVVAGGFLVTRKSLVASPVSVATAYMDANSEYDTNAVWELLASDSEAKLAGLAALTLANDWARAVGWAEIPHQGCEEISTDAAGTLVACPFIRQTDWILALGLEPVTNNVYEILVSEGQIQSVVETDNGEVSRDGMREASRTFQAWVVANHPDDMSTMYGSGGQWLSDPAAIALYEKYTDEFVAYMDTPESVARAFMRALNTHDGNAAVAQMAPDGLYDGDEASMIPGWFDYDRAIGSAYAFQECVETSSGPDGTVVECPILQQDDRTRVLGIEPMPGRYEFLVEEGQIQSADSYLDNGGDAERAWQAFDAWLRANHNQDLTTMYITAEVPERTPEALVLWERYTAEFVASLEG